MSMQSEYPKWAILKPVLNTNEIDVFDRKVNFADSPIALFTLFPVGLTGIPDFVLTTVTLLTYIPDHALEQFSNE